MKPGQTVSFAVSGMIPTKACDRRAGDLDRHRGQRADPHDAGPGRACEPGRELRANQFGEATIQIGTEHKAVVVPKEAVQRNDNVDVVFLPEGEGVYRPQRVTTKPTDRSDVLEVTWGLKPGQKVVSNGAFLLKTEIMKGSIGAGCCE